MHCSEKKYDIKAGFIKLVSGPELTYGIGHLRGMVKPWRTRWNPKKLVEKIWWSWVRNHPVYPFSEDPVKISWERKFQRALKSVVLFLCSAIGYFESLFESQIPVNRLGGRWPKPAYNSQTDRRKDLRKRITAKAEVPSNPQYTWETFTPSNYVNTIEVCPIVKLWDVKKLKSNSYPRTLCIECIKSTYCSQKRVNYSVLITRKCGIKWVDTGYISKL